MLCSLFGKTGVGEKSGKSVFGILSSEQSLDGSSGTRRALGSSSRSFAYWKST